MRAIRGIPIPEVVTDMWKNAFDQETHLFGEGDDVVPNLPFAR